MVFCQCVGITDGMLKELIAAGASSVAEITRRCGAGRSCGPCREGIERLLREAAPHVPAASGAPQGIAAS